MDAKHDYREETAAEIAAPQANRVDQTFDKTRIVQMRASQGGTLVGAISLILSILSLFMMPFLFGILGIIGGFISRRRGAKSLGYVGNWYWCYFHYCWHLYLAFLLKKKRKLGFDSESKLFYILRFSSKVKVKKAF